MRDITSHITTVIGTEPMNFDVAITSIGITGAPGFLNSLVLEAYGYPLSVLEEISLSKGYYLLESKDKKTILFIVTVGRGNVSKNLNKNLRTALNVHLDDLKGKKIWVPLMATGAGEMSFEESYEIISSILRDFNYCDFTIAIPDNIRGNNFVENYKVKLHNFIPQNIKARAQKAQSKHIKNDYYSESVKESFESQSSEFATESNAPNEEEPIEKPKEEEESVGSDKIPFHLDVVEDVDRLNREPIAKSLTRLLNNQIFKTKINNEDKDKSNFAFMVHLQGAWGDGKSTFLNLIEKNLDSENNKWIVIHFNAWQNQHISPPWWPFLDQIYRQSLNELPIHKKPFLLVKEQFRRLIKYSGFSRLITIVIVILLCITLMVFQSQIFELLKLIGLFTGENGNASLKIVFDTIVAISSILGLFYALANFISKPFFISSPESAKTFLEKSADPMQKIKKHFQSLINDIDTCGFKTAIFIDDLDRCNDTFTVELLEGIQTLFRDMQVLYVVAGDRHWICTCFENHYKDYDAVVKEPTQKLGYLFLEKAFQLSLRLPNVSGDIKKSYWDYILKLKSREHKKEIIGKERRDDIMKDIQKGNKEVDYSSSSVIQGFKTKYNLNEEEATDITLEILDKDNKDVNHILQEHFDLLDTNPRGIKRLANQYNIHRNTLVAEGKSFDRDKLFRWIILQNKYPVFTDWIENNLHSIIGDIINDVKWKEGISNDFLWKKLVHDDNNLKGGKLVIEDIKVFTGLQNS